MENNRKSRMENGAEQPTLDDELTVAATTKPGKKKDKHQALVRFVRERAYR